MRYGQYSQKSVNVILPLDHLPDLVDERLLRLGGVYVYLNDKAALPVRRKSGIFIWFARYNPKFTVCNAETAMLSVSAEG